MLDTISSAIEVFKFLAFLDGFVSSSTDVFSNVIGSLTGSAE